MEKLSYNFVPYEVLDAQRMNGIAQKIDEIVEKENSDDKKLPLPSRTDNDGNMNNLLEQGVYPYCTLGRPANSKGYYTLVVRRSTTADGNGYYTVEQTAYGRNEDEGKVFKRILFDRGNGDVDYHEWINCSGGLNKLAFSGILKCDTVTQSEIDNIMNALVANEQAWYIVGNSSGATSGGTVTFSSVLAKLVHPEDTRGVAANLGDFICFAKDANGNKLYQVIPVNDAKAPQGDFAGTYGILTPNDRMDIDNAMMQTYGEQNMNNALDSGFYPWCTMGRPANSVGAYTCIVQRSRQVDGNGFFSVMQTAFGRQDEIGRVFQRVIFYKPANREEDNYGEWIEVSNVYDGGVNFGIDTTSNVPTDKKLCIVETDIDDTFGLRRPMTAGTELQVIINNTGRSEITITIPDTFKSNGVSKIAIGAGKYGEINIIYDGTNHYLRAI